VPTTGSKGVSGTWNPSSVQSGHQGRFLINSDDIPKPYTLSSLSSNIISTENFSGPGFPNYAGSDLDPWHDEYYNPAVCGKDDDTSNFNDLYDASPRAKKKPCKSNLLDSQAISDGSDSQASNSSNDYDISMGGDINHVSNHTFGTGSVNRRPMPYASEPNDRYVSLNIRRWTANSPNRKSTSMGRESFQIPGSRTIRESQVVQGSGYASQSFPYYEKPIFIDRRMGSIDFASYPARSLEEVGNMVDARAQSCIPQSPDVYGISKIGSNHPAFNSYGHQGIRTEKDGFQGVSAKETYDPFRGEGGYDIPNCDEDDWGCQISGGKLKSPVSSSGYKTPMQKITAHTSNPNHDFGAPDRTFSGQSFISNVTQSRQSSGSVQSIRHIGVYPIDTLRVYSPSSKHERNSQPSYDCLKTGDVVIVRDIQSGSVLGYNMTTITVSGREGFDGIKCIPPGLHFFWGGPQPKTRDADQFFGLRRNGFWVVVERLGVDDYGYAHVLNWDCSVLEEQVCHAEALIQRKDLPGFFDSLTDFETDELNILRFQSARALAATNTSLWFHMTSCIKNNLLTKITRHSWNKWQVSTHHEYAQQADNPGKDNSWDGISINFNKEVLRFMFPKGEPTSRSLRSRPNHKKDLVDTSHHVLHIVDQRCTYQDTDEIVGEFQFCFIVSMKLGNEVCIDHYRHILRIMFRAYGLILRSANLMCKFIEAFHAHMIYNEDLEVDIFAVQPYFEEELTHHLTLFKLRLDEIMERQGHHVTSFQKKVVQVFDCLESFFFKKAWNLRRVENYLECELENEIPEEVTADENSCARSSWSFSIGDDRGISHFPLLTLLLAQINVYLQVFRRSLTDWSLKLPNSRTGRPGSRNLVLLWSEERRRGGHYVPEVNLGLV